MSGHSTASAATLSNSASKVSIKTASSAQGLRHSDGLARNVSVSTAGYSSSLLPLPPPKSDLLGHCQHCEAKDIARRRAELEVDPEPEVKGRSTAIAMEIKLKEMLAGLPQAPNVRRSTVCLDFLRNVAQLSGSWQRILELLLTELRWSIYQRDTSIRGGMMPFFTRCDRMKQHISQLEDDLTTLAQQLSEVAAEKEGVERERDGLAARLEQVRPMSQELYEANDRVKKLESELESMRAMKQDMVQVSRDQMERDERAQHALHRDLQASQALVDEKNRQIEQLRRYEQGHRQMSEAFARRSTLSREAASSGRNAPESWSNASVVSAQADQMKKLRQQIVGLCNRRLEEYEDELSDMQPGSFSRREAKRRLQAATAPALSESVHVQAHIVQLERMAIEEVARAAAPASVPSGVIVPSDGTGDGDEAARHASTTCTAGSNAVARDLKTPKSLYAATLMISTDRGRSFQNISGVASISYCERCQMRTVMCPHLSGARDLIIDIPTAATHIKLVRPTLRFAHSAWDVRETRPQSPPLHDLLWRNFHQHAGTFAPVTTRRPTLQQVMRLKHEVYAMKAVYEASCEAGLMPMSEYIWRFFQDQYGVPEMVKQLAFDYFTAISMYQMDSVEVEMLARIITGELPEPAWRYLTMLDQIVQRTTDIHGNLHIDEVMRVIYPRESSSTLVDLANNFKVYAQHQVASRELLYSYFTIELGHRKEFRVQKMRDSLALASGGESASLTFDEFRSFLVDGSHIGGGREESVLTQYFDELIAASVNVSSFDGDAAASSSASSSEAAATATAASSSSPPTEFAKDSVVSLHRASVCSAPRTSGAGGGSSGIRVPIEALALVAAVMELRTVVQRLDRYQSKMDMSSKQRPGSSTAGSRASAPHGKRLGTPDLGARRHPSPQHPRTQPKHRVQQRLCAVTSPIEAASSSLRSNRTST